MDRQALHRLVKRAVRRAGVNPKASSHWLRHASATHAIAGGCDIQTVRERLGHASLATTTRYAHAAADKGLGELPEILNAQPRLPEIIMIEKPDAPPAVPDGYARDAQGRLVPISKVRPEGSS